MARPPHVSMMHLLRQFRGIGVTSATVAVELQGAAFDVALEHLQGQPGRANQPTDVTENSFRISGVEVRRV